MIAEFLQVKWVCVRAWVCVFIYRMYCTSCLFVCVGAVFEGDCELLAGKSD